MECKAGEATQQWNLSPGVTPGDSKATNVQMDLPHGGCWEITGCSSGEGADVGCGYGCKPLPKSCKSKCDCNGAWSFNSNGTITSVMDGHCLQVSKGKGSNVNVASCSGKPNQVFAVKNTGNYYTISQAGLCVQGRKPPTPAPTPLPCKFYKTQADCPSHCKWNAAKKQCGKVIQRHTKSHMKHIR